MRFFIAATLIASSLLPQLGHAQSPTSHYSDISNATCREIESGEGGYWLGDCGSAFGYNIRALEMDARNTILLLRNGKELQFPIWDVTDGAFNGVGEKFEWRGTTTGGTFKPFAGILRAYVTRPTVEGEWDESQTLVVAKIDGTRICLVGSVDATKVANANVKAREIADSRARSFRCGSDTPVVIR